MATITRIKKSKSSTPTKSTPVKSSRPRATSGLLSQASAEVKDKPLSMVLYGPPGVGKSSFAAFAPNPLFIVHPKEAGIYSLKAKKQIPKSVQVIEIESFSDKLRLLDEIATAGPEEHGYEYIIEDSLTWIEQEVFRHCSNEEYDGDFSNKKFFSYWAGPRTCATSPDYWNAYINSLNAILETGVGVILIAHAKQQTFNNPEGENYTRYVPKMENQSWESIHAWIDNVLFLHRFVRVEKDSKLAKGKGSGGERYLECTWGPAFEAKSKGLPDSIEMGTSGKEAWSNFITAYNSIGK